MSGKKLSVKEAFAKIKKLLMEGDSGDPPQETAYTLKDGTNIKVLGELAEGSQVVVVTADGQNPIPDGEYELSDGGKITCTGGAIATVTAKAEEDPSAGLEMEAKMAEQGKAIETLTTAMTELATAVSKMQTGFNAQKEATTQILAVVEQLADAGAAPPVTKLPDAFKKADTSGNLTRLSDTLKKLKENK